MDGDGSVQEKASATSNSTCQDTRDDRRVEEGLLTPINEMSPKAHGKRTVKEVRFRRNLRTNESDPHTSGRFYYVDDEPTKLMKRLPVGGKGGDLGGVDDVTTTSDLHASRGVDDVTVIVGLDALRDVDDDELSNDRRILASILALAPASGSDDSGSWESVYCLSEDS